jgi:hypothetical protein
VWESRSLPEYFGPQSLAGALFFLGQECWMTDNRVENGSVERMRWGGLARVAVPSDCRSMRGAGVTACQLGLAGEIFTSACWEAAVGN